MDTDVPLIVGHGVGWEASSILSLFSLLNHRDTPNGLRSRSMARGRVSTGFRHGERETNRQPPARQPGVGSAWGQYKPEVTLREMLENGDESPASAHAVLGGIRV